MPCRRNWLWFYGACLLGILSGCGARGSLDVGEPRGLSGSSSGGNILSSSGGGGTCAPSCTTNEQCQSTCAAAPAGGVNCCDSASGICYSTAMAACAAQTVAAAE